MLLLLRLQQNKKMPREFTSQVEEVRATQDPYSTGEYELMEFAPQDKSKTLDYRIAHELLPEEKGSVSNKD